MTINKSYNKVGMPESYTWNGVQELSYDFELETGNLLSRTDILKGLTENFGYDDLNRLTSAGSNTFDFDYQKGASFKRNFLTLIGGAVFGQFYNTPVTHFASFRNSTGFGGSFSVEFKGNVTIPK